MLSQFEQFFPTEDETAVPLSIFVSIQYIADPGGALWGPSSALSARMERRK